MQALDIVLLIILGIGLVLGGTRGLLAQLASLLGIVVGLYVAKLYYVDLAAEISPLVVESLSAAQIISFIAIWLIVPIVFGLFADMITKFMEAIHLGWFNRLMGSILGVIKYGLLLSALLCVLDFVDSDNKLITETKKTESVLYYPMKSVVKTLFFAVKDVYLENESRLTIYNK